MIVMRYPKRQRGMTLIVGMIMLILITLATVASFNMGKTNTEIIANLQHQNEAVAAANNVIQEVLSTTRMFTDPGDVFEADSCGGVANRRCIDSNGDGIDDVIVDLNPQPDCVQARTILNAELAPELQSGNAAVYENAANCIMGTQQGVFAIEGVPTGSSACAASVWEIVAVATDAVTEASVTVTEGAAVRVATAYVDTSCP